MKTNILFAILVAVMSLVSNQVSAQDILDGNKNIGISVGADYFVSDNNNGPRGVVALDYRFGANIIMASAAVGDMNNQFSLGYKREFGKYYKWRAIPFAGVYASMAEGVWSLSEKIEHEALENAAYGAKTAKFMPSIGINLGARIRTKGNQSVVVTAFANYGFPAEKMVSFDANLGGSKPNMQTVALTKPEAFSFGVRVAYRFVLLGKHRK